MCHIRSWRPTRDPPSCSANLGMTGPESALQEDSMVQRAGVVATPTALTAKGFSVPYTGSSVLAKPAAKAAG